jgi:tRNA(Leu) C34 or U34 (ribose-2'-O)-methylase TrmL
VRSLNVAVSAGIALFEAVRQRGLKTLKTAPEEPPDATA